MRLPRTFIAALLLCTAVHGENPSVDPEQEAAAVQVTNPMESFARMVSGQWQVTFQSRATMMFDIWNWGPGRHSMQVQTDGTGAAGEPWRGLQVYYWHPGRKQVCLLGLSPFLKGVSAGTISFEGETADAVYDLYQAGRRREMGLRWTFDGPDRYRETMLEASGSAGLKPLNELEFVRSKTLTAESPRTDEAGLKPSKHLKALESLVGHTWEATGDWATGGAFQIRSTLEWVPHADFISARSVALTSDGESTHLLDAYVYHHNGTDSLRCLALSNRGTVYEGDLTVLEDGSLQFDLKSYEGDQIGTHVMRLDFEQGGTLRDRAWSVEGAERTLMRDVHHRKLDPKNP